MHGITKYLQLQAIKTETCEGELKTIDTGNGANTIDS